MGTVKQSDEEQYVAAMDAARFREELPSVEARLTSRPAPARYLLEIALPPATKR